MSSRRPRSSLVVAAIAALLTAAVAAADARAPARQAGGPAPRLTLAALDPPAVHGAHFRARERVTVRLQGLPGGTRTRHRRASAGGAFSVEFTKAAVGRCGGFTVRARGDAGSRAMVRRMQLPGCSSG
jgi:hypothetical protein